MNISIVILFFWATPGRMNNDILFSIRVIHEVSHFYVIYCLFNIFGNVFVEILLNPGSHYSNEYVQKRSNQTFKKIKALVVSEKKDGGNNMGKRTSYNYICGLMLLALISVASCIGQDLCENITCGRVCRGFDLWEQKCIGGECVDFRIIESNSEECGFNDLCKDVSCNDGCFGTDLYRMRCSEGECVPDYILEKDSEQCGVLPPEPPPETAQETHPDDTCKDPDCDIVDDRGCPLDSDGDGLPDCYDRCPTQAGAEINEGCLKPGLLGWEDGIPIIDWMYADQYYGEYVIVEGTIVNTYNSGQAHFLNFHSEWKKYFSAVISYTDFYKFHPEVYYCGKKVRIRGVIKDCQGKPEIFLEDPSQIEIIS
jgi:hypothetical protein